MRRILPIALTACFFLLTALPLAAQLCGAHFARPMQENRRLAPPPALPKSLGDLSRLPEQTRAWTDDHFGLRRVLIRLNNAVRFRVFGESGNPQLSFGRHGQLFLTSHTPDEPQQLLFFLCRGGGDVSRNFSRAQSLARLLDTAARRAPHIADLLVPTKTVVDAHDLPPWMRARCSGGKPALPAMLAALGEARPDLASRVIYPLERMQSLREDERPFPPNNFHWNGAGVGKVADWIARTEFHRVRLGNLPVARVAEISDIAHLLPGVTLRFNGIEAEPQRAGIESHASIPALGYAGGVIQDLSEFVRHDTNSAAAAEPRLLIVSDSFGAAIAPWFSAYYGEVRHIAINNLHLLSPAQQASTMRILFDTYRPDDLLLVFHDFSQAYINDQLVPLFAAQPTPVLP